MELPISYLLGGKPYAGIPETWQTCVTEENGRRVITGISPEGLELRFETERYDDFDGYTHTAFFTNRGKKDTEILENVRMTALFAGTQALLEHGNGDTKRADGYQWKTEPVEDITIEPFGDGTSCYGAFPYMRLHLPEGGVNMAFGWTGDWTARFVKTEAGIRLAMGQKRCHMVIRPGETVRVPSLTVIPYKGDADAGRNTWRRWYFAHILPKENGQLLQPRCCMHYFQAGGKPEFTGATEENQLAAMDGYLQNGIRPDVWWIDAGWYPCDYVWQKTGTWRHNEENFPRGLKPIGDRCKELGMEFLLWFEPERIQVGTEFAEAHPQWCLKSTIGEADNPYLLVNLGDAECCEFVTDMLDGFIKDYGVNIYRQDFNLRLDRGCPAQCWLEAEAEDRIGAMENQHIQGYYRMWDVLLERNPGLLIDSCASGGRRNDIETMRRSVPLHYTDVGYGNHPIKLKQHRQMFEWIPYFRAHNMNWCGADGLYDRTSRKPDRYSYYAAMAPSLTDMTAWDATAKEFALAREMQAIWRKAAQLMLGTDYYPLTECRKSADDFYAAQFHDTQNGRGMLHLLNGATATESRFTVRLKGLDADASYHLTASEGGELTCTGRELMAGFAVTMPQKTGNIWFYEQQ